MTALGLCSGYDLIVPVSETPPGCAAWKLLGQEGARQGGWA